MTTDDIGERILAAFQVEYREQLEGIRATLENLATGDESERKIRIDEAFRLAHSMKGGARVCDLKPIESMGHELESIFSKVRCGELNVNESVVAMIHSILDGIEDRMFKLERGEPIEDFSQPPDSLRTLPESTAATPNDVVANELSARLHEALRNESLQYVTQIQEIISTWGTGRQAPEPGQIECVIREIDNLRGAARAAEVQSVEQPGERLETLVRKLLSQPEPLDRESYASIQQQIDCISDIIGSLEATDPAPEASPETTPVPDSSTSAADEKGNDSNLTAKTSDAPTAMFRRCIDTVHVSAESLDQLLRTSRQLQFESLRQDQVAKQLKHIRQQFESMQRERDLFQRAAVKSLHQISTMPSLSRITQYLDYVDRSVASLGRDLRQVCIAHKKNSWALKTRSRQMQREVRNARMVPAETIFQGIRRLVRDLAKQEGKDVQLNVVGFDVNADRMVLQALKDPVIHMLRNCLVHGIETPRQRADAGKKPVGQIDLRIEATGNRLTIEVEDDGRGIDHVEIARRAVEAGLISADDVDALPADRIAALIFEPGFSTATEVTEIAGRGMGLSVVDEIASTLQGEVKIHSSKHSGTVLRICVPVSVSTHRLLLVLSNRHTYAIPIHAIARLLTLTSSEIETVEGRPVLMFENKPLPIFNLAAALCDDGIAERSMGESLNVVILKSSTRRAAFCVDSFLSERDLLIQNLEGPASTPQFLGAILLEDGRPALVVHPGELLDGSRDSAGAPLLEDLPETQESSPTRVLVVDDSFTTRTLEQSILEANGFHVVIAVDGVEALAKLKTERFDLVISDVEMPRMDGFELLEAIKKNPTLTSTPVILVTSCDRATHRHRGLELGANAYILKQKFDHESLLNTIRQIVDN